MEGYISLGNINIPGWRNVGQTPAGEGEGKIETIESHHNDHQQQQDGDHAHGHGNHLHHQSVAPIELTRETFPPSLTVTKIEVGETAGRQENSWILRVLIVKPPSLCGD